MGANPARTVLARLARGTDAPDAELLARWAAGRDESAFAALVRRHGPMVLAIGRRLAPADADDAFQATFLVLARKAGRLAAPDRLGPWLHGVARRVARRAAARRGRERTVARLPEVAVCDRPADDLAAVVHEEVGRLPEAYRVAVLLCDLEGVPRRAAAERLGLPAATLTNRLTRARALLGRRLVRRGVGLGGLAAAGAGAVPPGLVAATVAAVRTPPAAVLALAAGGGASYLWLAVAGLAVAVGLTVGRPAGPSSATDPPAPPPTPAAVADPSPALRLKVIDPAGRPVAGAAVHASVWSEPRVPNQELVTGPDGVAAVRRPAELKILRVWVAKDGFAGVFRGWEPGTHDNGRRLPAEFTVPLTAATSIGGRVVDEAGKPVAGVRVEATFEARDPKALPDGLSFNRYLAEGNDAPRTDAAGRWRLANVPPAEGDIRVRLSHPGYVSDDRWGSLAKDQGVTTAQLRAGTAVVKLAAGGRVSGTVTDAAGRPVAKAVVAFHPDPYQHPGTTAHTDAAGRYTLPALKPGKHPLTVIAPGHAPARREVELAAGPRTEDFRLEPGKPLRVKVVDPDGKPVAAYFMLDGWRGNRGLFNDQHSNVPDSGIPRRADKAGLYEWAWAPADPVTVRISHRGFREQTLTLTAGDAVQTVTLARPVTVGGRVTDARTGKSVGAFRVFRVLEFSPGNHHVERDEPITAAGGAYSAALDRTDTDYRLLVEADGYRTALSGPSLVKNKSAAVDFALEPAAPLTGRVLAPDGKPLAKATVHLATTIQGYYGDRDGQDGLSAQTDAAGRFTLPAQAERFLLVAEHAAGSARFVGTPDQPVGDLTVRPWASVRGTLYQDGKPVPDQTVFLSPLWDDGPDGIRTQETRQARTDAAGAFTFVRVPAEPLTVRPHLGPWQPSPLTSGETVALAPNPGEAVALDLGRAGATLTGRLALAGELPPRLDCSYSLNVLVRRTSDLPGTEPVELRPDWPAGRLDDALRAALAAGQRQFFVKAAADGTVRAVGVPAGDYWFVARVYEKPEGCLVSPVGVCVVPLTVTPGQAAGSEPVPLPPLPVPVAAPLAVGKPLPALALTGADGRPLDLSAYRGRHLLLHGWAGWCTACPKDYPGLRKLRADLPADKLAVVGLNLDADPATTARLAARYGFAWPQAHLGRAGPAADRLGVGAVPLYLVVAPDGTLARRAYSLAEAETFLRDTVKP